MQKKGRKNLQKRLLAEKRNYLYERNARIEAEWRASDAEGRAKEAESKAENFKARFRAFGKNVETIDPGKGKYVVQLKWEIKPEEYGACVLADAHDDSSPHEMYEAAINKIAQNIARGLIDNELVQFKMRDQGVYDPLSQYITIAGKVYVVPWEQMPHRQTLELRQFIENAMEEGAL